MASNAKIGECNQTELATADGHRIRIHSWTAAEAKGTVLIFHGLAEHATRYERFARECNNAGFHVVAHNHRGHGENCEAESLGHFADENGWNIVINDAHLVHRELLKNFPDLPMVLFGHSMGSFIAQSYTMRHAGNIAALILSGSTYGSRFQLRVSQMLAVIESWRHGVSGKSSLLNRLGFGSFNKAFAPNRTEFDWLSRDAAEVEKYIADRFCGAPSSCQLWRDLTGGLLEITSARSLGKVPADLPVLIAGGALDPIGGGRGMTSLADRYRDTGHTDVTLKIYPEARHEILNEINRDEVTNDLIHWISEKCGHSAL